ncbi:MAG: dihydrolipoyl dehydrogenase family protein, partial [Acidimicrobiales bacterium]
YDLVIVGMGSGGMVAAEFAAGLGLRVAVVERGRVGGDCLWTGCVPSKALLASAKAAHTMRHADDYGLAPAEPAVDTARVWRRVRSVQHAIATSDDDPERFASLGVELVLGAARLTGPHTVAVTAAVTASPSSGQPAGSSGDVELDTEFVLLCTGSHPAVPPIEGLAEVGFLTSESIFELERAPASLTMIGGGPISLELSQAFIRLGIATTVLQKAPTVLPRDEPELVAALAGVLRREGVDLQEGVQIERVTVERDRKIVHGSGRRWEAEELFLGAGRQPNLEGLGLDQVGVRVGDRGVQVDGRMRSNVPSVYAAGDVAGRYLFTHSAAYEAVRAVRDMFFPGRGTVTELVPWCTFTDPELAHVGMTSAEAVREHGSHAEVWRSSLSHSDRARAESEQDGAFVIVTVRRRVVGAHILAPAAGEMIHELALAVHKRLKIQEIAGLIHVYPTLSTSIGRLASDVALAGAERYRWLMKGRGRRSGGA